MKVSENIGIKKINGISYEILCSQYKAENHNRQIVADIIDRVLIPYPLLISLKVSEFKLLSYIIQYNLITNESCNQSQDSLKRVLKTGKTSINKGLKRLIRLGLITEKPYLYLKLKSNFIWG